MQAATDCHGGLGLLAESVSVGSRSVCSSVTRSADSSIEHGVVCRITPWKSAPPWYHLRSSSVSSVGSLALAGPISVMVIGVRRNGFFSTWSAAQFSTGDH